MGYEVEYREVDGGTDWRTELLYEPSIRQLLIEDLILFKTYEIKIRAVNTFGKSSWSPVTVIYLEMGNCEAYRWKHADYAITALYNQQDLIAQLLIVSITTTSFTTSTNKIIIIVLKFWTSYLFSLIRANCTIVL